MRRRAALLAGLALMFVLTGAVTAPHSGWRRGVNLDGWLSAGPFVPLGAVRLSQLRQVRAAGFDFVRVPLDPALFISARPGASEPSASFDRLLLEARVRGLGVVVSLTPGDEPKRQVLLGGLARDTYLVLLERLSARLAAARLPRALIEPMDEPVDPNRRDCAPSAFDWNAALTDFVAAVRRGAPGLTVLVSGVCYADVDSMKDLRPLSDHNVVYGFQYLDPLNFTQQGNQNNDDWKKLRGVRYTARDAATMRKAFVGAGGWARQYGLPVLVTAFAVHDTAPKSDRLRWLRDVRVLAEEQQFAWTVWSWQGSAGFGLSGNGQLPGEVKRVLGLSR